MLLAALAAPAIHPGWAAAKGSFTVDDALELAAIKGDVAAARGAVAAGADVNRVHDGMTPLMRAAQENNAAIVRLLIKARADVNAQDSRGWTALRYAGCRNSAAAARVLLEHGADPNAVARDGTTPLVQVAACRGVAVADLLIKAHADLDHVVTPGGYTALMAAALEGDEQVAKLLVSAGADPTVRNPEGRTALDMARGHKHRKIAALLLSANRSFAVGSEHRAPVENLAAPATRSPEAVRQALLSEMWQRRILSSESQSWDAEDLDLLLKIRAAEQLNAVELLQRRVGGPLGDLVVPYTAPGSTLPLPRLTKAGYERWRFFRAQDAIDYFTDKGVDSGLAFQLVDLDGRKLFDGDGLLTAAGDEVYDRALANLPVWWKLPGSPEIYGTRPPSQAKQPSQPQAPQALDAYPVTIGPEHAALMQRLGAKYGRPYDPQLRVTALGRLRVVMEYEPSNTGGSDAYIVVVARKKDKAAARRELEKEVPSLGVVPFDKILTVQEKLAGMERNLKRLSKQAGGELSLDRSAVDKQLRQLLKGKLAVAWVLSNAEPPAAAAPPPDAEPAPAGGAPGSSTIQTAPTSATEPAPPDVSAPPQPQAPPPQTQDKP